MRFAGSRNEHCAERARRSRGRVSGSRSEVFLHSYAVGISHKKAQKTQKVICVFCAFLWPFLQQLALNPLQFLADIVNDVAGLQAVGQDVPRVSLDLELTRNWIRLVKFQSIFNGKPSSAKRSQIVEEHRNVNVCAPFAGARV